MRTAPTTAALDKTRSRPAETTSARRVIDSPLGPLRLEANAAGLTRVEFEDRCDEKPGPSAAAPGSSLPLVGRVSDPPSPSLDVQELLNRAESQLAAYFANELKHFDLPLAPHGTPFQQEVWRALLDIPFGQTRTYAQIARTIGREDAVRAVGAANGANPIAIIIPCHRVIGADGTLTGYGGGVERKRSLLDHERAGASSTLFS